MFFFFVCLFLINEIFIWLRILLAISQINGFSIPVPVARIQAPLQDALVPEGQDALFSIELSASVIGTWFLNGTQLQEDERYSMRRSRTHQSLRIRGVRDTDNGAEITFIAYGIRDSAALYIQGMYGSLP